MDRSGLAGSSTVIDFTGPQRALTDSEPLVSGRRGRHGDHHDDSADEPTPVPAPGRRVMSRRVQEAAADDETTASRSRRRVGWRKGADVDEEMWPAEAFGGVSDEQFWDDLAADKPLATTARTAQPETAAKRRPRSAGPLPDLYAADDRGRGRTAAAESAGTNPQPRLGPDDRTAIQPAVAGTQPSATSARPSATSARPSVTGAHSSATAPLATQPYPVTAQPVRPVPPSAGTTQPARSAQPSPSATQPVRAAHQPAESRGRSRASISADEDPLTSPAYSLRPRGSVDGRSYTSSRRSGDPSGEQYTAAGRETRQFDRSAHNANGRSRPDPLRSDGYRADPLRSDPLRSDYLRPDPLRSGGGTAPTAAYPYSQQPHAEPGQSVNTPPYGERYGYGTPAGQASPAGQSGLGGPFGPGGDPRRVNGGGNPGRAGGNGAGSNGAGSNGVRSNGAGSNGAGSNGAGDGAWGSRPAYPPVNGHRGPYDPRGYDRRLTSLA